MDKVVNQVLIILGWGSTIILISVICTMYGLIDKCEEELQGGQKCKLIAVAKEEPK